MKRYITFGNWNKNYLFIIAAIISIDISKIITGLNYLNYKLEIFDVNELSGHIYIHELFYYLLILICSSLFLIYEQKRDNTNIKNDEPQNDEEISRLSNQTLIYNDIYYYTNKKISNSFEFFIIFLYVLFEHIDSVCRQFFSYADFWMLELIIMTYLNLKMFNIKIHNHQSLSIYLVFIPFILKVISIALFFLDENNHFTNGEINYKYNDTNPKTKSLFVAHAWLFPIAIILFFIIMVINSYLIISIKKIIDLKYVSVTKILILYGLFGTIIAALFSVVATYISCGKKNDDIYDIYDYICIVVDNNGERFVENYKAYFNGNIWKDLLIRFFSSMAYAFYKLFLFKFIQYLSPIYKSFSFPLLFFLEKIILIYQINGDEPTKYAKKCFLIDLSSDITAIIGFLIYLEIIELNFCGLNKNLRKYIIMRGKTEAKKYNIDSETDSSYSSEDNESYLQ